MIDFISDIISKYWSYLLIVAGIVVGLTKYYLNWLKIKESKLRINNIESNNKNNESIIYQPTTEEIYKYSQKNYSSRPSKSKLIYSVLVFLAFNFTLFYYWNTDDIQAVFKNEEHDIISIEVNPKNPTAGKIINLTYNVKKVGKLSIFYKDNSGRVRLLMSFSLNKENHKGVLHFTTRNASSDVIILICYEEDIVETQKEFTSYSSFLKNLSKYKIKWKKKEIQINIKSKK